MLNERSVRFEESDMLSPGHERMAVRSRFSNFFNLEEEKRVETDQNFNLFSPRKGDIF